MAPELHKPIAESATTKGREMQPIRVRWDAETNDADPGWVYYEEHSDSWQAVPGIAGRDRDALGEDIAAELGFGLDIEFERRGWVSK